MSDLERLLVAGCTEMPECRCGKEMRIHRTYSVPGKADTHIRVYKCLACDHEMRLTVWGSDDTGDEARRTQRGENEEFVAASLDASKQVFVPK